MTPPEKSNRQPPFVPRWPFFVVGGGLLVEPIEAIARGRILGLGLRYHNAGAILRSDEPRLFWFTVAAFAAASMIFICIGIFKGGRDA